MAEHPIKIVSVMGYDYKGVMIWDSIPAIGKTIESLVDALEVVTQDLELAKKVFALESSRYLGKKVHFIESVKPAPSVSDNGDLLYTKLDEIRGILGDDCGFDPDTYDELIGLLDDVQLLHNAKVRALKQTISDITQNGTV